MERLVSIDSLKIVPHDRRSLAALGMTWGVTQRMRIEENIRDTKCPQYGLGLKKSLTKSSSRMNILLLIGAIATFAAWLAGLYIKSIGKAADFQAHSAKFSSALSTVFLGRRAFHKKIHMTQDKFKHILEVFNQCPLQAQQETQHYG